VKSWGIGLALVLAAWIGHHAYRLVPVELEGHAWNIGGAVARLILLGIVVWLARSPLVDVPASWLGAEEAQAVGCTVAFIVKPWAMQPGDEKCSAALGLPLQTACLAALLWCAIWLADKLREGRSRESR
jgi:hypothetical protein